MRYTPTRPVAGYYACVSLVIALSLAFPALLPFQSQAAGRQIAGTVAYYGTYPGLHPIFVSAHTSMGQPPVNGCGITTPGGPYAFGGLPDGSYVAASYGGGLYSRSDIALSEVTFISNTATLYGGGMCSGEGSPSLAWTTLISNSAAAGGGLYLQAGSPRVMNASFRANQAAQNGGGLYAFDTSLVLANAAFTGNSAGANGGGAYLAQGNPSLYCASLVGNHASTGGGLHVWNGVPAVHNSILWANTATSGNAQICTGGACTLKVSYSIVQDGYAGSHVLSLDPLFVDADGLDGQCGTDDDILRLRSDSPAIDAGDNGAIPADLADLDRDGNTSEPVPFDLAGYRRRMEAPGVPNTGSGLGMIVDMGAFEYPWQPIRLPLVWR